MWLDNLAPSVKARVVDKIFDWFSARSTTSVIHKRVDEEHSTAYQYLNDTTADVATTTKRKCLFPYVNETKKTSHGGKDAILLELDKFLREKAIS